MGRFKTSTDGFAEVGALVRAFDEAVGDRDMPALEAMLAPAWHCKFADAKGGALVAYERSSFLARPSTFFPEGCARALTSVQLFFGDFAVARTDAWSIPAVRIQTLFKDGGAWRIAGEAYADAKLSGRRARFDPATEERAVLDVLDVYYTAVDAGTPRPLGEIFDAAWHMKNHEGGQLVSEDRERFLKRIAAGPTADYAGDRQVADVQIVYDRLAYVRVDRPSSPGVTVFLFFKLGGQWVIVDKAWSTARK